MRGRVEAHAILHGLASWQVFPAIPKTLDTNQKNRQAGVMRGK